MGIRRGKLRLLAIFIGLTAVCAGCETGVSPSGVGPSPFVEPAGQSNGPFTVSGVVTSGGQPVSDAVVIGFHESSRGVRVPISPNARTGPDGRFQFENVQAGIVHLYPWKRDYLHPCMATSPVSGPVELALELVMLPALRPSRPAPLTLTGTVVDSTGTPVTGAFVTGWWFGEFPELQTQTDAEGRYFLCGLREEFFRDGSLTVGGVVSPGFEAVHIFSPQSRPTPLGNGEFLLDVRVKSRPE